MTAGNFDWAAYVEPITRALLGDPDEVTEHGREWRYGKRGSLSIKVQGPDRGIWFDHETGEGGGVVKLIEREKGPINGAVFDWLRADVGLDIPERKRARLSTADYVQQIARTIRPNAGTSADAYLTKTRGLTGPFAADLGYHPLVWHKETGRELPALICRARDGEGAIAFIHAVFLDGARKAEVEPVKKTFGRMAGAAVRIPATATDAGNKLVLAEGPEDALSVAQATGVETWACCGVANFGRAPVSKDTLIIVAAQNDPADKAAASTLYKAVGRLRGRGLTVIIARPPEAVKDWNDLLRDAGPEAIQDAIAEAERRAGWRTDLDYNLSGEVRPILANAVLALGHDEEWHGVLGYDEFANTVVMRRPAPWLLYRPGFVEREWCDLDDVRASEWLQRQGIYVARDIAGQAVQRVASDHPFHPVRTWLDGLAWDGRPRLDTWLITYLGAADTTYTRAVGARWLIAAVARIYRPGCKVDTCLILEGPQGLKKSSALRALVGAAWFSDQMPDLGTKDSMVQVQGKWVIELAELDSLNRGEVSRIKAFMSTRVDRYREPYGKRAADHPRQCVFCGSVNLDDYLRDETGGRRFWPVRCGASINVAGLERDRGQLWAEAVARFRAGEVWWLDSLDLNREAEAEQAERYEGDPWQELVEVHLIGRDEVTVADILANALNLKFGDWGKTEANRVGRILRSLGWRKGRAKKADPNTGKRPPVFERMS